MRTLITPGDKNLLAKEMTDPTRPNNETREPRAEMYQCDKLGKADGCFLPAIGHDRECIQVPCIASRWLSQLGLAELLSFIALLKISFLL